MHLGMMLAAESGWPFDLRKKIIHVYTLGEVIVCFSQVNGFLEVTNYPEFTITIILLFLLV